MSLKDAGYTLMKYSGLTSIALGWQSGSLLILMYHGICPDRLATASWVPSYFVAEGQFEAQMRFLRGRLQPLRLIDAIGALRLGGLSRNSVAVTFDDGYLNNFTLGGPILERFSIPATVFLATGHITSGRLFNHDRRRLIRHWQVADTGPALDIDLKRLSVDAANDRLDPIWDRMEPRLTAEQLDCLRPATWSEVLHASPLFEFGAHTVRHAVLSQESDGAARREVAESVQDVRARLGRQEVTFAYPNGTSEDFTARDVAVLQELAVVGSVTTVPGRNRPGADPHRLLRHAITLGHTDAVFEAEVAGMRRFLTSAATY